MNQSRFKNILAIIGGIAVVLSLCGALSQVEVMFAGVDMVTGTIDEVNDAVFTEQAIENQMAAIQTQKRKLSDSLSELKYSESEIKEIMHDDFSSGDDLLLILRKTARNIKRAKAFAKRVIGLKQFNPSSVTAVNTADTARSMDEVKVLLSQIVQNQNRDYKDRVLTHASYEKETSRRQKMIHEQASKISTGDRGNKNSISFENFKRKESTVTERVQSWIGIKNTDGP